MSRQYRNVMFTSYEQEPPVFDAQQMRYMVYQRERCPTTQREHWQGYVELRRQMRPRTLHQLLGHDAHFERRMGTQEEAIAYCTKEESRVEPPVHYGEPAQAGKRTDLTALRNRLLGGEKLRSVVADCANLQQLRYIEAIHKYVPLSTVFRKKEVYWIHGPTGVGKTRSAIAEVRADDWWMANRTADWFDGYCGQSDVVIDEIRAKNWPYDIMLNLLDGFDRYVPIKGGFTLWQPKTVYITGPFSPEATYHGQLAYQGKIDQLMRRITAVVDMNVPPMAVLHEGRIVGCAAQPSHDTLALRNVPDTMFELYNTLEME